MLSRALSLATVTLLIGCLAAIPVRAQNLEAGKSPSQIFSGTCAACHKTPRGLLKTVPAGSLSGFLRQHYTTSSDMASQLGAYLIASGAADARPGGAKSTQQAKDARPADGQSQQAARPDADGQGDPGRQGRNAKRPARPGEAPAAAKPAVEGQQAAIDRGPDGRKSTAKQKLGKKGRGSEEPPKPDAGATDTAREEPAKGEPAKDEASKSETAKTEDGMPESSKPSESKSSESKPSESKPSESMSSESMSSESKPSESKPSESKPSGEGTSETAKVDATTKENGGGPPVLRADPVPPVTPAPKSADGEAEARPSVQTTQAPSSASGPSGTSSTGASEPAATPPSVTASVPPAPPPVAPAGPPAPPISQ